MEKSTEISSGDQNFPSIRILGMSFSGFPNLHIDTVDDAEVEILDSNINVCVSNTLSSRLHHSVSMTKRTWKVTTNLGPQDIWIEIQMDIDMRRCRLG